MILPLCEDIVEAVPEGIATRNRQCFVDVHCHCLPGLDDGPAGVRESVALCRELAADGTTTVVATPHQLGRFSGRNNAEKIRQAARRLNRILGAERVGLNVLAGSEVYVDENICRFLADGTIMTLADSGRYLLLELPAEVSVDITSLLEELASTGVQCVISHVERIAPFVATPRTLLKWMDCSAHLQITASSLLGDFGRRVQRDAWCLLTCGWVSLVATDSHNLRARRPQMEAAFQQISARLGANTARLVCSENPLRVVNGQDLLPVVPSGVEGARR